MKHGYPTARAGQVIGLFGGSFDPAHEGHVHVTLQALKRFGLDRVWWLVSPQNPLKTSGPAPLEKRVSYARDLMQSPLVEVTDIEHELGTNVTAQTLAKLRGLYPGVQFVWLMGADNLADFHKWDDWEEIAYSTPMGILARPGDRQKALNSRAARHLRRWRISRRASRSLGNFHAPSWCFVNIPMINQSSTAIRKRGEWTSGLRHAQGDQG